MFKDASPTLKKGINVKDDTTSSRSSSIDLIFRPEDYWGPNAQYIEGRPLWDEETYPGEVEIAEVYARLWWSDEEVGVETVRVSAYQIDTNYEIKETDVDEHDTNMPEIRFRVVSAANSVRSGPCDPQVGELDLGSASHPLTLEELIELIYPTIEDSFDSWFESNDESEEQSIDFSYRSAYYPQLAAALSD